MKNTSVTELHIQATNGANLAEGAETVRTHRNSRAVAEIHPVACDLLTWNRCRARA